MSKSDVKTKLAETNPEKLSEGVDTKQNKNEGECTSHTEEEEIPEDSPEETRESLTPDKSCESEHAQGGLGEGPDEVPGKSSTEVQEGGEGHSTADGDLPADDDDGLPIDRGWAWFVLAGSFLNVFLMIGYGRSIGILFVEYLHIFEASAATTTLFMGVMAAFFSLTSLISMNVLLQLLGERKLVLLGAVITTVGMLTAVFATSITFLICTHSVLIGIGHSMIHGPALVLIGKYFKKRRGLATSIAMSGVSVGGSVMPPLVRIMVDQYGVRGSMLLFTGLNMNMLVGAALYRPIEFYQRRRRRRSRDEEQVPLVCAGARDGHASDETADTEGRCMKNDTDDIGIHVTSTINPNHDKTNPTLSEDSKANKSNDRVNSSDPKYSSLMQIYSSNPDMTSIMSIPETGNLSDEQDDEQQRKGVQDYLKMIVVLLDVRLFKDPMFQFFVATSIFAILIVLVAAYLPALAAEKGVPPTEASLLLSIYGGIDFFSKLAAGYVADLKRIKSYHIAAVCLFLTATATSFSSLYNSFAWMVSYSVLLGLFGGVYNSLIPILIADMMGVECMAKVLGFLSVFHGFAIAVTHPIIGSIRDLTGSYNACMNYIGACVFVAAIGLMFEPLAQRRAEAYRRKNKGKPHKENC